jgi:hypothetical protein
MTINEQSYRRNGNLLPASLYEPNNAQDIMDDATDRDYRVMCGSRIGKAQQLLMLPALKYYQPSG